MIRLVLVGVLFVSACKDSRPAAADATTASALVADAAPSMAHPSAADAAAAAPSGAPDAAPGATSLDGGSAAAPEPAPRPGGKIGVEACDEYLEKMARCVAKLSPESADPVRAAMEDTRKAWQQTAATPEGQAALADACRSALDAAKGAARSMGCSW